MLPSKPQFVGVLGQVAFVSIHPSPGTRLEYQEGGTKFHGPLRSSKRAAAGI